MHSPTPKRLNSPSGVPPSHFPLTGSPCNPARPCSPLIDLDDSRRITRRTADMAHPNCGLFKCGILVSPMQPRALCSIAASAMSGHFKSCSLPSFWPWAKTQVQVLSCLRIVQTALRLWRSRPVFGGRAHLFGSAVKLPCPGCPPNLRQARPQSLSSSFCTLRVSPVPVVRLLHPHRL